MEYSIILFWGGKILFGGFFVVMGMMHFMKNADFTQMAKSKNIPMARLVVMVAGVLLIGGGLSIISGRYIEWGVGVLIAFLVPAAFLMHTFWKETDPNTKMVQMAFFMRNMALTGATLLMLF